MRILLELFKKIYDRMLSRWIDKETGEILIRTAFAAAVISTIVVIYAAYTTALAAISVALPAPFDFALIFLPDNTSAVLTAITSMRIALFVASLKLGLASIGVK